MSLYPHFIQDDLFVDKNIAASRVHLGKVGERNSPIERSKLRIWVEGEAYNLKEVAKETGLASYTLGNLLLEAEAQDKLKQVLNKLDGYFCAVIYNEQKKKIKLISDRYGMRVLYWYLKDGLFAWGSSVKAILAVDGINKALDQSSYSCFMDLGYLLGEHTWFEYIKLIKPATILEFDIKSNSISQVYYWTWDEIKPSNISFDEAVDKLGELFIEAVARRFNPEEKIGISLSGGLDSRAIFAALNHLYPSYSGYAFTFGIPGCDDFKISEKVIDKTKWKHTKFNFTSKNWFKPRIKRIWITDGMKNMLHMHGSEFVETAAQSIDINLSGNAGDAVYGAGFINDKLLQNKSVNLQTIARAYNGFGADTLEREFYGSINHFDAHLFCNKERRFTNYGQINSHANMEIRKPFHDAKLMDFMYSIPDEYRTYYKLYTAMLQKFFPEFFKDIPWQNTGKPAAPLKTPTISRRILNKGMRILKRLLKVSTKSGYTDYPAWIRDPAIAKELEQLLNNPKAEYKKLTQENLADKYLKPHLKNNLVNNSEQILRAATLEIYLLKVSQ